MSVIYQPKTKCKDGGSYFYKDKEDSPLEKEIIFSVIPFQKFLFFHMFNFSENTQCFIRAFLS